MLDFSNGFLFGLKYQREGDTYHESKGGEDKPAGLPFTNEISTFPTTETIDNFTSSQRTDSSTKTVGHHHKQTLRRSFDLRVAFLINEDTTRDIEEVKGDTLDNARQDEEDNAWHSRIANAKESETEHPSKQRHEHYNLNTKTLQEEWNHQNAAGLTNL